MWYEVNGGLIAQPAEVDSTSSPDYVYVRRNFRWVDATDDAPAHWRWDEMRIPLEMWEIARLSLPLTRVLSDIYAALAELAALSQGVVPTDTGELLKPMSLIFSRRVDAEHMRLDDVPAYWQAEVRTLLQAKSDT
ncbi:MAG: hypothetical protein K5990_02095 [Oscillospiraceae bacterium]|nr:hypothetical protein [Oscillospiraceae bacterium]